MTLIQWLLLPLFIHVALVNVVGIRNLAGRIAAVMGGKTRLKDIALDDANWPDDLRKLGNNFNNQFEIPTLWYAACALIVVTGIVDMVQVTLSWMFIAARVVHTFIHTGSNNVRQRMYAFLASFAAITLMWAWFGLRLFLLG